MQHRVYALAVRHHEPALIDTTHAALRHSLAHTLRRSAAGLLRLAERLGRVQARRRRAPELEFYAEAGAPEGALYVDGQLIGMLPGVTRL